MNDKINSKFQQLSSNKNEYFIGGAIDHSPQEFIEKDVIYTSAFVFFTTDFHKKYSLLPFKLKPWKTRSKYRDNFVFKYWQQVQELPFFAYITSKPGNLIHKEKWLYIKQFGLDGMILQNEKDGVIYDKYIHVYDQDMKPADFEIKEKISLGALYITDFMLKCLSSFNSLCHKHNILLCNNPFNIFHDNFPGKNFHMPQIILSRLKHLTIDINLAHWETKDSPDDLLADNLAGLFNAIKAGTYDPGLILTTNKSLIEHPF